MAAEPFFRGRPPFGYKRDVGQHLDHGRMKARVVWVVDPETSELVRYIFRVYPRYTARHLANELNEKGKTDPRWLRKRINPDGSSDRVPWYTNDLLRMVANPIYMGVLEWGAGAKSERTKQMLAEVNQGNPVRHRVPELAIVSEEDWLAAQGTKPGDPRKARSGEGISPRTAGAVGILAGILRCPTCGETMLVHPQKVPLADGTKYAVPSYICQTYHRVGKSRCSPHIVQEREILGALRPLVIEVLRKLADDAVAGWLERNQVGSRRDVEDSVERLRASKARLYDDYYLHGRLNEGDYLATSHRLDQELLAAEQELREPRFQQGLKAARLAREIGGYLDLAETTEAGRMVVLPIDPPGPPFDEEGNPRRISEDDRRLWRLVVTTLIDHITIGYKANGARKKADVWVDPKDVVWRQGVVEMLYGVGEHPPGQHCPAA